jgi:hypothetical protein
MFGSVLSRTCSVNPWRSTVTDLSLADTRQDAASRATAAALAVLALTSIHHAYGAYAFETLWRLHVLAIAVPTALAIHLALRASMRTEDQVAKRLMKAFWALAILVVPVGVIGLYEGGYNHVVKNIVYFFGGEEQAEALFPHPPYEMPRDFIFEFTGIAQFPLSIATAILVLRFIRGAPQ